MKNTIYNMLTENTGKHFLDSGGDNGRQWQRNAGKTLADFEAEPEETFTFDYKYGDIQRTVSVFHYLTGGGLDLDDLCNEFNALQDKHDNWQTDADVYGVCFEAWHHLEDCNDVKVLRTWNTYNGESDLSQVLQGSSIEINGDPYLLVQVHGGADVRGGYTDAKLFAAEYDGMIHEYLMEYVEPDEIKDAMNAGYIETFADYWDEAKTYTAAQVTARLAELEAVAS